MTLPTTDPYGPRTPRVRHFLQRLARQPAVVWLAAARRWRDERSQAATQRADRALGLAIDRHGRTRERDALVGPIVQLARHAVPAAPTAGDDDDLLAELAEPALAAALALLAEDLLAEPQVAALYAPWAEAIPRDTLPNARHAPSDEPGSTRGG